MASLPGRVTWEPMYAPFEILWGHGSSPLLYKDSLILLCDHQGSAHVLALDKRTGRQLWKADRGKDRRSYATPVIVSTTTGDQLIINSTERIDALDATKGELLWHVGEENRVPVPTPISHNGILYASRGYSGGPYMTVKVGGRGDVSATHVQWLTPTGAAYISSLLHYHGLIYMATESGIASCVDASTGKLLWRERLGGVFSASPVAAEGRVYLVNEAGEAFILEAGRELKILARNHLSERTLASPAISGGLILLRTDEHLVAVGNQDHPERAHR